MKTKLLRVAFILLPLIAGIFLGIWQVKPPSANEDSPAFQRMMYNIERLTAQPRVVGTIELEQSRNQIIAEIEDMGLTPITHFAQYTKDEAIAANRRLRAGLESRFHNLPDEFTVKNIFVELESPTTDRGILLVSHYDSWPGSPGAADAMAPVAAILEAMRSQAGNENLTNSIFFLITDGEEFGAIGALAFIHDHPELRDRIDMVINLEAQGSRGGLILFETSPQAYSMLDLYRGAVPRPLGFSIMQTIYESMYTYTDFCFFREYGWNGINMAAIEGLEHYHQPTDNYENLNRDTAWHFLTVTLGFAQYAADNSLDTLQEQSSQAVFFPLFPGNMVLLSYAWAYILCILACLLALAYFVYEYKNKRKLVSFTNIRILVFVILSLTITTIFNAGSYLFWLPLLAMTITAFTRKWEMAYRITQMASRLIVLLLWVPLVYLTLLFVPFLIPAIS